MCTAITYQTDCFYFGRTLDYDMSYAEEIAITPRNCPLRFRSVGEVNRHYAIIGMAYVPDKFPLYYDAVNEKGLCMAGLNFVGNAHYSEEIDGEFNLAQFELIPYLLATCSSVKQALDCLKAINLTNVPHRNVLPPAQLHWLLADKESSVTIEFMRDGLKIHSNPVGVLTNNPPFAEQLSNLTDYLHLSPYEPKNTFSEKISLIPYSRGMGAIGLPGDVSSKSRFVRAAFMKLNAVSDSAEAESVNAFFHILGTVSQPKGCCILENGRHEMTIYTSCCNADRGIYYYTTYENHSISAVDLFSENLEDSVIHRYPLAKEERILFQNRK